MVLASIIERVIVHLMKELSVQEIDPKKDLFSSGVLDSYTALEFILFVEGEFEIQFTQDELTNREISRVEGLAKMIHDKVKAKE
jgi:acyl carrier protein